MDEMCETCIFHPGNQMNLRRGRVREMVRTCLKGGGVIPCHCTLDLKEQAVCRGFFDRYADRVPLLGLAKRVGAIFEFRLDKPS